jgi:hypothetical protein
MEPEIVLAVPSISQLLNPLALLDRRRLTIVGREDKRCGSNNGIAQFREEFMCGGSRHT